MTSIQRDRAEPGDLLVRLDRVDEIDAVAFIASFRLVRKSLGEEMGEELEAVGELLEAHPLRSEAAFVAASQVAQAGWWDSVGDELGAVDPEQLADRCRRHYYHLLGIVRLHNGRVEKALAAFRQGERYPGSCRLDPLIELTRPMSERPRPRDWSRRRPLVRQALGAIRTADRAFENGDLEAARKVFERPVFWQVGELQSFARLARIWLEIPARSPRQRFQKRRALAFFCHLHQLGGSSKHQILLPDLTWDEDRLAELAEGAAAWLDGGGDDRQQSR